MFYQAEMEDVLRFGDVVKGFVFATPKIDDPLLGLDEDVNYSIDFSIPRYSVILTPCCSIEEKTILLSPLIQLRFNLFNTPYFRDDLTRINRPAHAKVAIPPEAWDKIPPEEKEKLMTSPATYQYLQLFVYEPYPKLLPGYTVKRKDKKSETGYQEYKTSYYMIDFASIYRINCDRINRSSKAGTIAPAGVKYLQLSIYARKELRDKFLGYFNRIPAEEELELKQ